MAKAVKSPRTGRPSKLTDRQWEELEAKFYAGADRRELAKQYGISEAAIRGRLNVEKQKVKEAAKQILTAKQALAELPLTAQLAANDLANELFAISQHLVSAGKMGAMVAKKTMHVAAQQAMKIDPNDVMGNPELLQGMSALTKISNDASLIGRDLLRANKEREQATVLSPPVFNIGFSRGGPGQ